MEPPEFNDETAPIARLKDLVRAFSIERDWEQFHTPKDLGIALACEVGELLEHFRYRRDEEVRTLLDDLAKRREVADELADCLWLILRLADVIGVDLASTLVAKVADAARKYPVELARGRADKYTAYLTKLEDSVEGEPLLGG
jgi:dCTP diphosphatase